MSIVVQKYCRSCLSKETDVKWYHLSGAIPNVDVELSKMIEYCTKKEVSSGDHLSFHICSMCFKLLRITYNFLKKYEESQIDLENRKQELDHGRNIATTLHENFGNDEFSTIEVTENPLENHNYTTENIADPLRENNIASEGIFSELINLQSHDTIKIEVYSDGDEKEALEQTNNSKVDNPVINQINDVKIVIINPEETGIYDSNIPLVQDGNTTSNSQLLNVQKVVKIPEQNEEEMDEMEYCLEDMPRDLYERITYKCPMCSKITKAINKFREHLESHNKNSIKCTHCDDKSQFTISDYIDHYNANHRYQCSFCPKRFISSYGYMYHMRKHKEERPHVCPHKGCNKHFYLYSLLKKHVNVHSNKRKFQCKLCSAQFNTYDTMRYHQKTHGGQRNFLCPHCGKSYLQSVHLKDHIRSRHSTEKLRCVYCAAPYCTKTGLKKHHRFCTKMKTTSTRN